MSIDGRRTKWRRNIAENFNRLSSAHERYRQTTDRQTNGRTMTYSERERREFTTSRSLISSILQIYVRGARSRLSLSARRDHDPALPASPVKSLSIWWLATHEKLTHTFRPFLVFTRGQKVLNLAFEAFWTSGFERKQYNGHTNLWSIFIDDPLTSSNVM